MFRQCYQYFSGDHKDPCKHNDEIKHERATPCSLAQFLKGKLGSSALEVMEEAIDAVAEWTGEAPADDDMTLVIARRTP